MKLRYFPFFIVFYLTVCITLDTEAVQAQPGSSPSRGANGEPSSDSQPRFEIVAASSTTRDAVIGDGTPASCTEAALNGALAVGGLITFNCGTAPHTIVLTTSKVIGADSLDFTLDGGGKITLDGNETVRHFEITAISRTITLANITLEKGNSTDFLAGGAVRNLGRLNIINSIFLDNQSSSYGGAIYSFWNTNIIGSSFVNNTAVSGGGAFYDSAIANIANSTFSGNSSTNGGAALDSFDDSILNITNTTISGNGNGAAIYKSDGNTTLRNVILSNNTGDNCNAQTFTDGGGNIVNGSACNGITAVSTTDPVLSGLVGSPRFFALKEGSPALNAVSNCTYLSTGTNPLFTSGAAVTTDQRGAPRPFGAACDVGAFERINIVGTGTGVSCTDTALDWALPGGGMITFNCGAAPVTIPITTTKVLTANALDVNLDGGGLITLDGGNAVRLFAVFGTATTLTLQNMTLTQGNAGTSTGGAVFNGGNLNVFNVAFMNNTAEAGGAIMNEKVANVFRTAFIGNSAPYGGGAIINNSSDDILNIANSTFSGNTTDVATGFGSAIGAWGFVSITNTTISGGNAEALHLYNGTHQLRNVILSDNDTNCDVGNPVVDGGGNIVNGSACNGITPISTGDPLLGSLEGNPPYFPIGFDSPAKDTVTNCTYLNNGANPFFTSGGSVTVDQRGIARPFGAFCDVGAYEFDGVAPTATPTATSTPDGTTTPGATNTPDGTTTPGATSTPDTSTNLLLNASFETADANKVPESWTQKNPTSDNQVCNKVNRPGKPDKVVARTGTCAYQFKSGVAENSKLQQTIDLTTNPVVSGDTLTLGGFYTAKGAVSAKVKVKVKYTDTTLEKGKITATISAEATTYTALAGDLEVLIAGAPASIKVQLQNKGISGKVIFDDVSMEQTSSTLLPLP